MVDNFTGEVTELPRYGAWISDNGVAKGIVDTSDDLEYLKTRYNTDQIVSIKDVQHEEK